jgi:hypothetical protein
MSKRIVGAVVTAGAFVMWSAATALAQTSTSYPPSPKATTSVEAASGGSGQPTAFTGGRIGFAVLAIAILLVVGIVASVVARRRSARVGG